MRVRLRMVVPKPDSMTTSRQIRGDVDLVLEEGGLAFLHHPNEPWSKSEVLNVDGRIRVEIVDVEQDDPARRG